MGLELDGDDTVEIGDYKYSCRKGEKGEKMED